MHYVMHCVMHYVMHLRVGLRRQQSPRRPVVQGARVAQSMHGHAVLPTQRRERVAPLHTHEHLTGDGGEKESEGDGKRRAWK